MRRLSQLQLPALYLAVLAFLGHCFLWHVLRGTLYNPIPREHRLGLAESNPLWGTDAAPARGETEFDHQIRNHVAHQLVNFADHYAPQRPLEHVRRMVYPSTGQRPQLTWLHWASTIAPHDLKTIRTENYWIFTLEGPEAAAKAVHRAMMDDPHNSLLLLDLAYANHYNPDHRPIPGQYSLQVFKNRRKWSDWDMNDTSQLAQILFSELKTECRKQGPNKHKLSEALAETINHLQQLRRQDNLPEVTYERTLELINVSESK